MDQSLTIQYISHSGFLVTGPDAVMLFDYYKGALPDHIGKPLYIFASHRHNDHFNPEIFRYGARFRDTHFILSDDISPAVLDKTGIDRSKAVFLAPNTDLTLDSLQIHTLGSTDEGVAFLVKTGGRTIFHAGDLNWWLWAEEATAADAQKMTEAFKREVQKLQGEAIDAAFLPLDPRQADHQFWLGLDLFARTASIRHIFPMHMWDDYSVIGRFKKLDCSIPYRDKIADIRAEGQIYEI